MVPQKTRLRLDLAKVPQIFNWAFEKTSDLPKNSLPRSF